jgi:hypothetical protein
MKQIFFLKLDETQVAINMIRDFSGAGRIEVLKFVDIALLSCIKTPLYVNHP